MTPRQGNDKDVKCLSSTGGCHERERQPTLASASTESNSTTLRREEQRGAGEREIRGHKGLFWCGGRGKLPSNYCSRSDLRTALNVASQSSLLLPAAVAEKETIWSRADSGQCKSCKGKRVTLELEGQFEGGGARRVPRCATLSRQTQLIGRIRRECCKIQSSSFSHLSNPKCCRSSVLYIWNQPFS